MRGVPVRIDLGLNDLKKKKITLFRRDLDKKEIVNEKDLVKRVNEISKEFTKNLIKKADKIFEGRIKKVSGMKELVKSIEDGMIAKCNFCSVEQDGAQCAEKIKERTGAEVRGTKFDEMEKASGKCIVCGRPAEKIVYVAKAY
jgi:prolyl-tRNA synthetase